MLKTCRTRRTGSRSPRRRVVTLLVAIAAFALGSSACSHKSVLAPEDPGEPEVFFNWLPALLVDQSAAQPSHEIMSFMDDPTTYVRGPALAAILDRLGNAPQVYRSTAPGYRPADEPILDAIGVYIQQMRLFQSNQFQYLPDRTLQRDQG